jgi:hypothetical protein
LGVIDSPPSANDRGIDIAAFRPAHGNYPTIPITITALAFDSAISGKLSHDSGAVPAALVDLAVFALTGLLRFRRVDSPKANTNAVHVERVAVDDPHGTGKVRR